MQNCNIGISKPFKAASKLQNAPLKFPETTVLSKKAIKLLEILEVRSLDNNGDTKIYTTKLVKILNYSLRTIYRCFNELEEHKFIHRVTETGFNAKRVKSNHREGFYSIRVIRCNRILLANRFKVRNKKDIGWKTDVRPKINVSIKHVPEEWLTESEYYTTDEKGNKRHIKPKWESYIDLVDMGLFDIGIVSLKYKLEDMKYFGDKMAIEILGYTKRSKEL